MNATAVRRAIYGKLAGDTTLNAMLGAAATGYSKAIYHDPAPEHAKFPFVVFSKSSGVATDAFGRPAAYDTDIWLVKAVDQNTTADAAEAIQERVRVLLNDAALSVSGGTVLMLRRRDDSGTYSEVVNGELFYHAGVYFRLVTASSS